MTSVGLRELKCKLGEYVRLAAHGERVLVTDRGRVVAELRRPEPDSEDLLADAVAKGLLRIGLPNDQPELYDLPALKLNLPAGATVASLLDDLRDDR